MSREDAEFWKIAEQLGKDDPALARKFSAPRPPGVWQRLLRTAEARWEARSTGEPLPPWL